MSAMPLLCAREANLLKYGGSGSGVHVGGMGRVCSTFKITLRGALVSLAVIAGPLVTRRSAHRENR